MDLRVGKRAALLCTACSSLCDNFCSICYKPCHAVPPCNCSINLSNGGIVCSCCSLSQSWGGNDTSTTGNQTKATRGVTDATIHKYLQVYPWLKMSTTGKNYGCTYCAQNGCNTSAFRAMKGIVRVSALTFISFNVVRLKDCNLKTHEHSKMHLEASELYNSQQKQSLETTNLKPVTSTTKLGQQLTRIDDRDIQDISLKMLITKFVISNNLSKDLYPELIQLLKNGFGINLAESHSLKSSVDPMLCYLDQTLSSKLYTAISMPQFCEFVSIASFNTMDHTCHRLIFLDDQGDVQNHFFTTTYPHVSLESVFSSLSNKYSSISGRNLDTNLVFFSPELEDLQLLDALPQSYTQVTAVANLSIVYQTTVGEMLENSFFSNRLKRIFHEYEVFCRNSCFRNHCYADGGSDLKARLRVMCALVDDWQSFLMSLSQQGKSTDVYKEASELKNLLTAAAFCDFLENLVKNDFVGKCDGFLPKIQSAFQTATLGLRTLHTENRSNFESKPVLAEQINCLSVASDGDGLAYKYGSTQLRITQGQSLPAILNEIRHEENVLLEGILEKLDTRWRLQFSVLASKIANILDITSYLFSEPSFGHDDLQYIIDHFRAFLRIKSNDDERIQEQFIQLKMLYQVSHSTISSSREFWKMVFTQSEYKTKFEALLCIIEVSLIYPNSNRVASKHSASFGGSNCEQYLRIHENLDALSVTDLVESATKFCTSSIPLNVSSSSSSASESHNSHIRNLLTAYNNE